jgi:Zn-dependent protease
MEFNQEWLVERLTLLVPLILSLSVHEWAHAWSAWKLGDDTARLMGRLTLNPIAHVDPIGTILLPLLNVPFGWAKPVPVNPLRFTRRVSMRTGMMITALAGPLSNVILAVGTTVVLAMVLRFAAPWAMTHRPGVQLLKIVIAMNVGLAIFNMLPIPPLDGSRVVNGLLPRRLHPLWEEFSRVGPIALLLVLLLPRMAGVSILAVPMRFVLGLLGRLLVFLGAGG